MLHFIIFLSNFAPLNVGSVPVQSCLEVHPDLRRNSTLETFGDLLALGLEPKTSRMDLVLSVEEKFCEHLGSFVVQVNIILEKVRIVAKWSSMVGQLPIPEVGVEDLVRLFVTNGVLTKGFAVSFSG